METDFTSTDRELESESHGAYYYFSIIFNPHFEAIYLLICHYPSPISAGIEVGRLFTAENLEYF